jgi:hypothetical protein
MRDTPAARATSRMVTALVVLPPVRTPNVLVLPITSFAQGAQSFKSTLESTDARDPEGFLLKGIQFLGNIWS